MKSRKRKSADGVERPMSLVPPRGDSFPPDAVRTKWLEDVSANFVQPLPAHRAYYRAILECLWPMGHGIPGPYRTDDEARAAIDGYRRKLNPNAPPYHDVFRRIRELQGEEGVVGVVHQGKRLQLVTLGIAAKRVPRIKLTPSQWASVLRRDGGKCTVCGRAEDEEQLDQDHRVPRLRGGGNELSNWQPLCGECNNHKSTQCRNCDQDCQSCPWAFPEKYGLIRISPDNILAARSIAKARDLDVHGMVNGLLRMALEKKASE